MYLLNSVSRQITETLDFYEACEVIYIIVTIAFAAILLSSDLSEKFKLQTDL